MEKFDVTATVFVIIVISCIAAGFVSALYWRPNNDIEDVAEEVTEYATAMQTHSKRSSEEGEVEWLFPDCDNVKKQ